MSTPNDPLLAVRQDVVEGVRSMLETFDGDEEAVVGRSPDRVNSSVAKLQADPPGYTVYMLLAFCSVSIRLFSHETGRAEMEILDEISHGFHAS